MHPPRCRSRSVGGAEGTRDPARGWQPAPQRGSAWQGSRLPRPACACPVLGWVSPPPETPSAPAEDARGGKKAWHCVALRCSILVAFHYRPSHRLPSPRVTFHHTVACLASPFLLLCSMSRLRAPGAVATWNHLSPGVSIGMSCRSSRVDGSEVFRLFAGRDVLATVAPFLSTHAIRRIHCSARHSCDEEGIWSTLLGRVNRAVSALSVKSAR